MVQSSDCTCVMQAANNARAMLHENDSHFHCEAPCLSNKCDCKRVMSFTADELLFTEQDRQEASDQYVCTTALGTAWRSGAMWMTTTCRTAAARGSASRVRTSPTV